MQLGVEGILAVVFVVGLVVGAFLLKRGESKGTRKE